MRSLASFAGLRRSKIHYDMFDLQRSAEEARRAGKLKALYHKGQDLAWDGREVLQSLLEKHGGIHVSDQHRRAIGRIFDVILWGELAAWKISAELADHIVPLEAKMAATSQVHDEARHFYVMYDYLQAMGYQPQPMDRASRVLLDEVLATKSLACKLSGMQLQVETMALTLFQAVRETRIEPVLADLLVYYEKDEARHVGLGLQYLPELIRTMSRREALAVFLFQLKIVGWSLAGLKSLEGDLRTLQIDPRAVVTLGRTKQMVAFRKLWDQLGLRDVPNQRMHVARFVNGITQLVFPREPFGIDVFKMADEFRRGWDIDPNERLPYSLLDPTASGIDPN